MLVFIYSRVLGIKNLTKYIKTTMLQQKLTLVCLPKIINRVMLNQIQTNKISKKSMCNQVKNCPAKDSG